VDSLELERRARIEERTDATARVKRWTVTFIAAGAAFAVALSLAAAGTFAGHQQAAAAGATGADQPGSQPQQPGSDQPQQQPGPGQGLFGGGGGRPVAVSGGS
jgi:hypothetical protein